MNISKVTLRPVDMHKVVALASIVIDDCFVVHDLRVVNGDKGVFVAMPSRKLPNGDFRDVCHPINTDARNAIQNAVLQQFESEGGIAAFNQAVSDTKSGFQAEMAAAVYPNAMENALEA